MRALCWEDCLWILLSQGPIGLSGFYQECGWGRGTQLNSGSSAHGLVPIQQIRLGQITQRLFCDTGSLATWPGYPAVCSQHPGCRQVLVSQSLLLKAQEKMKSWSQWCETAEGQVASLGCEEFHPVSSFCGSCVLGLQFTNEIKMPTACLSTHLLRNTLVWTA